MQQIEHYMNKNPESVSGETFVLDVIKRMRTTKRGAVLVKNQGGDIVGIFTERDVVNKVSFGDQDKLKVTLVSDFMTKNLISIDASERYGKALDLMKKKNIRHLAVKKDGCIVGLVSVRAMMQRYGEILEEELKIKETQVLEVVEKTKKSEGLFRLIFNNSSVGIVLADTKGKIIAWNPLASRILSMDAVELINKPIKALYPEEEWKKIQALLVDRHGEYQHIETKVVNRQGEKIDVEVSISMLKDPDGKVMGSIGIMQDIGVRKSMERELQKSLKELKDIKYSLDQHDIIAITDKEGKITYVNDKFCELSKYPVEELFGNDLSIVRSGDHSEEFYKNMWRTIEKGKVWHGEIKNKAKDNSYYWVNTTIVPFLDEKGKPFQYIRIYTDITDLKRTQEEIELANRDLAANARILHNMVIDRENTNKKLLETQQRIIQVEKMASLGTLAAGFAHEIKNPLAIIAQGMERVEKTVKQVNGGSEDQYVEMIKSAAFRANKVVSSLLQYSRASQIEMHPVGICHAINAAVDLVQGNAKMHNIAINKKFVESDYIVLGDHIMLQQVFFDLFTNAIDMMPEGGEIVVVTKIETSKEKPGKGKFIIQVSDTGPGIDEDKLVKVFDPFFTTKDEGKGTGLGLSIVYMILEKHGGSIEAKNKKGKGTTFIITLPAVKPV